MLKNKPLNKADLVLLQETNLHPSDHKFIQSTWNSPVFFASIGGRAGTLILTRKNSNIQILSHWSDPDGRVVQVTLRWNDLELTVSSVYAPSKPDERIPFFENFLDTFPAPETALHLIGGDFNCIQSLSHDKSGGDPTNGNVGFNELQDVMSFLDLEDLWRIRNPHSKEFTFTGKYATCVVRSRLDRWLSSSLLRPFVQSIEHVDFPLPNLDHKAVIFTLSDPDKVKPGPGYWKFNSSLLKDSQYTTEMKKVIALQISLKPTFSNTILWWEGLKVACKSFTISFAKSKAKAFALYEDQLLNHLKLTESLLNDSPDSIPLQNVLLNLRRQIDAFQKHKLEGLILRSRAKFLDARETPSRAIKMISSLSIKSQEIPKLNHPTKGNSSDPQIMMETATLFYSNLFRQPPLTPEVEEAQNRLLQAWPKSESLSPDDPDCGEDISSDEALVALKSLANHRTPGIDGLPSEFYLHFWDPLGPHITHMLNAVRDLGLSQTQSRAVVSLVYKKGDPTDISNYRPISVLCHDYKILAKVLVLRLHKVTNILISPDQTGVKNRFIGENIRHFLESFEYLHLHKKPGLILLLDQAKAFDVVSWTLLHKILAHAGLSFSFRQWIHRLYEGPTSQIKINNHLTDPFDLHCGVRQGCPLSPILFCLCIESLAKALRADPHIQGIPLPGYPSPGRSLIDLYLDDIILYLLSQNDLIRAKSICQLYGLASNASLNISKCEGIAINQRPPAVIPDFAIPWLAKDHPFKFLGVSLTNSYPLKLETPWAQVVQKISATLKSAAWQFSLKGRVTFIKTYVMSQLYYLANALPMSLSHQNQIQKMLWKYVWKNARAGAIRQEILSLPCSLGGMGFPSVSISIKAIQMKWIARLLSLHPTYSRPWAVLASHSIQNLYSDWGLGLFPLLFRPARPSNNMISPFWDSAVKAWWQLIDQADITSFTKEEILSFPIFLNPYIQHMNIPIKASKWRSWTAAGIIRIRDLWNDGAWVSPEDLRSIYGFKASQDDIDLLVKAVPQVWHDALLQRWDHSSGMWGLQLPGKDSTDVYHILQHFHSSEGQHYAREHYGPLPLPPDSFISGSLVEITDLEHLRPLTTTTKQVHFSDLQLVTPSRIFLHKIPIQKFSLGHVKETLTSNAIPEALISWNLICPSLDWKKIFQQCWKPLVPRTWNQTFYLLLLRGLPHGDRAHRHHSKYPPYWLCPACQQPETLQHIFFDCSLAQNLLCWITKTWKNGSGTSPPLDLHFVLTGLPRSLPRHAHREHLKTFLSAVHRAYLQTCWRIRCDFHHSQTPTDTHALALMTENIKNLLKSWSLIPRVLPTYTALKTLFPALFSL